MVTRSLRTRIAASFTLLAMLLVTAACGIGGGSEGGNEADPAEPTESATAAVDSFPVTIMHAFGETTVPAEPKRVVVAGLNEADYLYSLGVAPVGVHEWWGEYDYATGPWAEEVRAELGAEPEVQQDWDINLEWVAAQRPDLIVVTYHDVDQAMFDKLSKLAPVVAQHQGFEVWTTPWRDQLRQIAEAVGRTERGEEVISEVDGTIEALVEQYPTLAGGTFDTGGLDDSGGIATYSSGDILNQSVAELGLSVPTEYDEMADGVYLSLSPERLDLLDLLDAFVVLDDTGTMEAELAKIPTFAATRLSKEARVVAPSRDLVLAMSFNTPLSIPYYLTELAPMLAAAVDGDPQTEVPD